MSDSPPGRDRPAPTGELPTKPSYGPHAARGMVWTTAGLVIAKLASFGSQLALGWLLSKNDFAVYAIAISVSSMIGALHNGGVQRILLQRGREYDHLASPLFKIGLMFNLTAAGLILAISPWAVGFFGSTSLYPLMAVFAISIPMRTAATVMTTKLGIQLRFATLTKISTASAVLHHGSAVVFALLGMGPLSFVLPLWVVAVFDTAVAWWVAGVWPKGDRLTPPLLRSTLAASGWVIFGSIGFSLAVRGDNLVLGRLATKTTLAYYFFGYQLVGSLATLFTTNFGSVLTPTFAHLAHQPDRQSKAFLKAMRVLSFYVFPTFVLAALTARPAIEVLWAGKWNNASIVVQLIALSSTLYVISALSRYLFQANGRWQVWAWTLIVDAIGTVLAALIGAWIGGLLAIAACIGAYRFLYGVFMGLMGCWVCKTRFRHFFTATGPPLMVCLACGLLPYYLFDVQGHVENPWLKMIATAVVFAALFFLLSLATIRRRLTEAVAVIRTR